MTENRVEKYKENYDDNKIKEQYYKFSGGWTPIQFAVICNKFTALKILLETPKVNIHVKDNDGRNLIHLAAVCGHSEILQELLGTEKFDVDAQDNNGMTAAHYAVSGIDCEVLCNHAHDIYKLPNQNNKENCGVHHVKPTCQPLSSRQIEFKFKAEMPNYFKFEGGFPSLHLAVACNNLNQVKCLIKSEPLNINVKDAYSRTPMHIAAICGYDDIIEELVRASADVIVKDENGYTPFMHARKGQIDCTELCKKVNCDYNDNGKITQLSDQPKTLPSHHPSDEPESWPYFYAGKLDLDMEEIF